MKTLVSCASLVAVVALVLLLHGGGSASDSLGVAVANAATACPEGFTVTVQGLPAGSAPTSSLTQTTPGASSCVLSLGIPAGSTGASGPPGTAGSNGVSGYGLQTVKTKSPSPNTTDRLVATAKCPPGKKAIGGGGSINENFATAHASHTRSSLSQIAPEVFAITTSQPTSNGQDWVTIAVSDPGTPSNEPDGDEHTATLTVTAICATAS
jgi:hypothetical protein